MKKVNALIWKEWREARLFFYGIIILMIFIRAGMALLNNIVDFDYEWFLGVIGFFVFPAGFSFLGCFAFSNEFTQETEGFLFSQNVNKKSLFWLKLFSGSVLIIFLLGISCLLFYQPVAFSDYRIIPITLSVLSLFFSMIVAVELIRKPLSAIFVGSVILLVISISLFPFFGIFYFNSKTIFPEICLFISILIIVTTGMALYIWNTAIIQCKNGWIQFLKFTLILFAFVWVSHFFIIQFSSFRLHSTIDNISVNGLQWGWSDKDIAEKKPIKDELAAIAQMMKKLESKHKLAWSCIENSVTRDFSIRSIEKNTAKFKAVMEFLNDSLCNELLAKFDELMKPLNMDARHGMSQYRTLYLMKHWRVFSDISEISEIKVCLAFKKEDYASVFKNYNRMLKASEWNHDNILYWKSRLRESFLQNIILNLKLDVLNSQTKKDVLAICARKDKSDVSEIQNITDQLYTDYMRQKNMEFGLTLEDNIRIPPGINASILAYVARPILNYKTADFLNYIKELQDIQSLEYYKNQQQIDTFLESMPKYDWGILRYYVPYELRDYLQNKYKNEYWMQMIQITLALKLYKGKHGQYPDSLDLLTPDILPEIPINPITGKVYRYQRENEGCVIFSEKIPKKVKSDSTRYSYTINKIKYGRIELDIEKEYK